jgi:hypothetical protein
MEDKDTILSKANEVAEKSFSQGKENIAREMLKRNPDLINELQKVLKEYLNGNRGYIIVKLFDEDKKVEAFFMADTSLEEVGNSLSDILSKVANDMLDKYEDRNQDR